jgi:hypothetical protein
VPQSVLTKGVVHVNASLNCYTVLYLSVFPRRDKATFAAHEVLPRYPGGEVALKKSPPPPRIVTVLYMNISFCDETCLQKTS